MVDQLKKDALEKFKDESEIKKFLDNIDKFSNYSYRNQLLIYLQKPDAKYVSSFDKFSELGYQIKKGAKSIKIFVPNFYTLVKKELDDGKYEIKPLFTLSELEQQKYKDKNDNSITYYDKKLSRFSVGNVFDASDTNMPLEMLDSELNPVLDDEKAKGIMDVFIKTIYSDGFKVEFKDLNGDTKGSCDFDNNTIYIRKGLGSLMELKVLLHEYSHTLAHKHLKNNNIEYQNNRNKYETEAEAISYVVSNYLGFNKNDYSLNYLYAWSKEKDFQEIDDSLNTIVNYSKRIINNFEYNLLKDKELDSTNMSSVLL